MRYNIFALLSACLIIIVLAFVPATTYAEKNCILSNPSFEEPLIDNNVPGWNNGYRINTWWVNVPDGEWYGWTRADMGQTYQDVVLDKEISGAHLSFYSASHNANGKQYVVLQFMDVEKQVITETIHIVQKSISVNNPNFGNLYTLTIHSELNAGYVRVLFYADESTIKVDSLCLQFVDNPEETPTSTITESSTLTSTSTPTNTSTETPTETRVQATFISKTPVTDFTKVATLTSTPTATSTATVTPTATDVPLALDESKEPNLYNMYLAEILYGF